MTDITERKRAEEALRESEANYRNLFDSSADGIFILDLDGNFIDANKTAYERLGYEREEFLSLHISELDHSSFAAQVPERFRQIREQGVAIFETGHLRKDGSLMPVEVNSRLFEHKGKQVFFSVVRDITERKKAEEALRASLERSRSYIEVTGQLGWTTNADGEVIEDLPSWRAYTGQSSDDIRGWGWASALHPDDVENTQQMWRKAVAEKCTYEVEYRLRRHDGMYRYFMARGIPVFQEDGSIREWVGTCIDITERKWVEEALRASEERLKRAQEIAHLGSWELDLVNDVLIWSDEVYRIFGLRPREFGASYEAFLESVHPDDRSAVSEAYSGSLRDGRDTYEIVHRIVRKDTGEIRVVHEKCEHFRDAAGRIVRSVGMVHDITERKRAEEALLKANEDQERHLAQLQTILANLTEGLVVADLDANLFHWNPAAVAMHGFSNMEECRRRLPEFADIFELSTAEEGILPLDRWPLARILRGETLHDWEVVIRRHGSGWQRVFNYGGTLARDKDGKPLLAIVTVADMTNRKRAEEALRKLNEELERKIAERTRFYSILAKTGEAIARVRDRQSLFEEVCRICVQEGFFRMAWVGLLDTESREVRHVASYGESAYLDGIRIVAADVPEGKGPTGRAVYENHYVINTDFEEDQRLSPWRDKARAHGLRSSSAFPLHVDGKVIGALTIYSDKPSFFIEEEASLLLSLCEDISFALDSMEIEKRRAEAAEDLRRLNEELEERVKLRTEELEDANKELESFIYSVSHDLRAPLRSMSGFVTFLSEDCGEQMDDRGKDYLLRIHKGAAKMSQLIEDLLSLSGITRRDIERNTIDMSVLAASIISSLREADPEREVSVSLRQGLTAFADPRLMEIALANLFSNAWKFTSKEKDARIEFGAVEKDGKTVYYVRDNGAGFDPEYIEKIFRPFQRLHSDEEFEGTGIGLAIVERIVRRHGGRIWAEGEKGMGATVFFTMD